MGSSKSKSSDKVRVLYLYCINDYLFSCVISNAFNKLKPKSMPCHMG